MPSQTADETLAHHTVFCLIYFTVSWQNNSRNRILVDNDQDSHFERTRPERNCMPFFNRKNWLNKIIKPSVGEGSGHSPSLLEEGVKTSWRYLSTWTTDTPLSLMIS